MKVHFEPMLAISSLRVVDGLLDFILEDVSALCQDWAECDIELGDTLVLGDGLLATLAALAIEFHLNGHIIVFLLIDFHFRNFANFLL